MNLALSKRKQRPVSKSWQINEDDFPERGTVLDKLEFITNCAALAPSIYGTQPWMLKLVDDAIEMYANEARALTAIDPDYRKLVISCGAALFHLRIAMRYFGYGDRVEILPERNNPNLLVRIRLGSRRIVQLEENFLFRAISKRCIDRLPFDECRLSSALISELESATCSEGNWQQIMTEVIPEISREEVLNLIAQERTKSNEIAPFANCSFNLGNFQTNKDRRLATQAPVLLLIGSREERPQDWIATGEALAHLLLRAKIDNIRASFLHRSVGNPGLRDSPLRGFPPLWELSRVRSHLQRLFPDNGYPQILLSLGYVA